MVKQLSNRDKAIITGLYFSKFDTLALNEFEFEGFQHAFNILGYSIGVKPASIKNYRDEFDPYFPNARKGWHKRPLRMYCKEVLDIYSTLHFEELTNIIKSFILPNYDIEQCVTKLLKKDTTESIAKRLATGKAAEEYFKINYLGIEVFSKYELTDARILACGFDFKLSSEENFLLVEVKGMNLNSGSILMTEKEYSVAGQFKEKYCLFVVKNFIEQPKHEMFFNPIGSTLNFKKHERKVVQTNYSTVI